MNYVDVARNVAHGLGPVQSTVGYNEPKFSPKWQFPRPFTAQPPMFPVMIAALSLLGVPIEYAPLLLSLLGYAAILLLTWHSARDFFGDHAAYLAVFLVGSLAPAYYVAGMAWSDAVGTAFVLAAIHLTARFMSATRPTIGSAIGGSLACALAFSTRYALLPLLPLCVVVVLSVARRNRFWTSCIPYMVIAITPLLLIVARNLYVGVTILGPARNASQVGIGANFTSMCAALLSTFLGDRRFWMNPLDLGSRLQAALACALWAGATLGLVARRAVRTTLVDSFRFLLPAWSGLYLATLLATRSRYHFDPIDSRLLLPAIVPGTIILAGLIVHGWPSVKRMCLPIAVAWSVCAAAVLSTCAFRDFATGTPTEARATQSATVKWLAQNSNEQDLVVGIDSVYVPFYLDGRMAVSFSPYPYTDHADYALIVAFIHQHSLQFRHFYIVLRRDGLTAFQWSTAMGPFFTDLRLMRYENYPGVTLRTVLDDGIVYEIAFPQRS